MNASSRTHFSSTVYNEKSNSASIYSSVKRNNSKATVGLSLSSLAFTSGKAALPSSQLVKEGQLAAVVKAPRPLCVRGRSLHDCSSPSFLL